MHDVRIHTTWHYLRVVYVAGLQKAGKEATGILSAISKASGFNSVCDMLEKIPEATRTLVMVKVGEMHFAFMVV